jgi:hypothetical protein
MTVKQLKQRHLHSIDEALDEALRSFASPVQNLSPSAPRSPAEAADSIRELHEGHVLPEGVTIRDLMTYGRAREVSDMSPAELEAIGNTEMDARHNHLDAELEPKGYV